MTDVVICARREKAATILPAVRAFRDAGSRVIVVDDGGNTGMLRARLAGAHVVRGPQAGKAAAMRAGLAHVRSDRVCFADADLTGLTPEHAARLTAPSEGMVTGLRDNRFPLGPLPPISGERSLPARVARKALDGAGGYGAELAINSAAALAGLPCETFTMNGVTNPSKQPLRRTVQVAAAIPRYLAGLACYVLSWAYTALGRTILAALP